jgi:hypothetical protein
MTDKTPAPKNDAKDSGGAYRATLNMPDTPSRCAATCPSASRAG